MEARCDLHGSVVGERAAVGSDHDAGLTTRGRARALASLAGASYAVSMATERDGLRAGKGARILGGLAVLALVVVGVVELSGGGVPTGASPPEGSGSAPSPAEDPPASQPAIALLGGLARGADVSGWKVLSITRSSAPDMKNAIAIWLEKDGKRFVVWVATKGRIEHHAPVETVAFGIFYGLMDRATEEDTKGPLEAIAARVREGEKTVANPATL